MVFFLVCDLPKVQHRNVLNEWIMLGKQPPSLASEQPRRHLSTRHLHMQTNKYSSSLPACISPIHIFFHSDNGERCHRDPKICTGHKIKAGCQSESEKPRLLKHWPFFLALSQMSITLALLDSLYLWQLKCPSQATNSHFLSGTQGSLKCVLQISGCPPPFSLSNGLTSSFSILSSEYFWPASKTSFTSPVSNHSIPPAYIALTTASRYNSVSTHWFNQLIILSLQSKLTNKPYFTIIRKQAVVCLWWEPGMLKDPLVQLMTCSPDTIKEVMFLRCCLQGEIPHPFACCPPPQKNQKPHDTGCGIQCSL